MNKIAIITTTRAEFGLLYMVIKELREYENESFRVELIVTGTHLSKDYGMTVGEIEDADCRIDKRLVVPVKSDTAQDISDNQAVILRLFTSLFIREHYQGILLLGDRYETLAIAIAAGNTMTPIFHMCGGDTTEGAIDEWIRHSITKMSCLHFVTNEDSRRRVIQMGEDPSRVYNFGSTSIDNIIWIADMNKEDALKSVGLKDCNYALGTYHPVTMDPTDVNILIKNFLKAIEAFPEIEFIITKSNADQGGARINEILDNADKNMRNVHVFSSLGIRRYLSLMKYAEFVIGNSSSGIIEAPSFFIPTINIGDRQKGRSRAKSVIDCRCDEESIKHAITMAEKTDFKETCMDIQNPYGNGQAAVKIASQIIKELRAKRIEMKKSFYDMRLK